MRPTYHYLPVNNNLYDKIKVPFGIYVQPFAVVNSEEKEISIIECKFFL
jgi:hypothetical protein